MTLIFVFESEFLPSETSVRIVETRWSLQPQNQLPFRGLVHRVRGDNFLATAHPGGGGVRSPVSLSSLVSRLIVASLWPFLVTTSSFDFVGGLCPGPFVTLTLFEMVGRHGLNDICLLPAQKESLFLFTPRTERLQLWLPLMLAFFLNGASL